MQVIACHALRKVVLQPEREAESVEPARCQQIQVPQPEIFVVKPRLVLDLAAKITANATYFVGRSLNNLLSKVKRRSRVGAKTHPLRQFQ